MSKLAAAIPTLLMPLLLMELRSQKISPTGPQAGLGEIRGTVIRTGTSQPIPDVRITWTGGPLDIQTVLSLANADLGRRLQFSPSTGGRVDPGIITALSAAAQARGISASSADLESAVNNLSGNLPTVTSDSAGRFVIKDVPAGTYTVRARKDGYYGPPINGASSIAVSVNVTVSGQQTVEVPFGLIPGAVISGRVRDDLGEPLSNMTVLAYSIVYQNGFPVLQQAASKQTDDKGEYRLFWIPPGEYYTAAIPGPAAPGGGPRKVKTFYPSSFNASEGMPIVIRGGEEHTGVDIAVRTITPVKISGIVSSTLPPPLPGESSGATGAAAGPVSSAKADLMILNRDINAPDDIGTRNVGSIPVSSSVGEFLLASVLPGSYDLYARMDDPATGGYAFGKASLDVRDREVNDILIVVHPGVEVKGTLSVSGTGGTSDPAAPPNVTIALRADGSSSKLPVYQALAQRPVTAKSDGSFAIKGVPDGKFRVLVQNLPKDLYVAEIRQGGGSVYDSGIEIGAAPPSAIQVILHSGGGMIQGVVRDSKQKQVSGATVVLLPEPERRSNRALFFDIKSDSMGKFSIRGLPPGSYKLFAWEDLPLGAYFNPAFLAEYEKWGISARISESSSLTADLIVIPSDPR